MPAANNNKRQAKDDSGRTPQTGPESKKIKKEAQDEVAPKTQTEEEQSEDEADYELNSEEADDDEDDNVEGDSDGSNDNDDDVEDPENVSEDTEAEEVKEEEGDDDSESASTDTIKQDIGSGANKKSQDSKGKTEGSASKSKSAGIIRYLLSEEAMQSISVAEKDISEGGVNYPSTPLSPFQYLVSSLLLSKPFSHRLGMRAISQIFSTAYDFSTPDKILDAGGEARWQALMDAHTLHKEKTSGQLRDLAQRIVDTYPKDTGTGSLAALREACGRDAGRIRGVVMGFNGFADKTTDIFMRQVQSEWDEVYPFIDAYSLQVANQLGLDVHSASDLADLVKSAKPASTDAGDVEDDRERVHRDGNDKEESGTRGDMERSDFVRVLNVMVGVGLDKTIQHAQERASAYV